MFNRENLKAGTIWMFKNKYYDEDHNLDEGDEILSIDYIVEVDGDMITYHEIGGNSVWENQRDHLTEYLDYERGYIIEQSDIETFAYYKLLGGLNG